MGAELWVHEEPWQPRAIDALRTLQARFVDERYDLTTMLPQHRQWAVDTVDSARQSGDAFGFVEIYERKIAMIDRYLADPVPSDPLRRVEIVRDLCADSGEGVGNVLDVIDMSEHVRAWHAYEFSHEEITRFAGSAKPARSEAEGAVSKISSALGRAECVCFPIWQDDQPIAWYFVGNTAD